LTSSVLGWWCGPMAGWGAFVGRERELSRLQSSLAERARLVLVVGDAGIGKTRFVGEGLVRAAAGGGLHAIGGGCLPLAEKLSLLPVADALGELSRLDGGAPFEAALTVAPAYVRPEVARLLPRLADGEAEAAGAAEEWQRERLFAAVAELLGGVARRSAVVLLIEDLHWADGATLDLLTYLTRAAHAGAVTVVATCRSDEVPLDAAVADWLTHVRRDAGVEEIRLGPLSRNEVAEQVTALVGEAPPEGLVEEVYARAEGHPFFTEQLVTAVITDSGQLALPTRLAELLLARAARCDAEARAVLAALAAAGRPLTDGLLAEITCLDAGTVRGAVRELTEARLLAMSSDGAHRPRHALLAEALAAELLPGERVSLHERVARALETTGGEALAAEAAGHWAAAGRPREELHARLIAARAAEQVVAYADAAAHWQRAIELCEAESDVTLGGGLDLPHLYMRAVDALEASGDSVRACAVAEQAYRRFADHPDPTTAAQVTFRAGYLRAIDSPAAGGPLMEAALRLFEAAGPSPEHARAWLRYALDFLNVVEDRSPAEIRTALESGLQAAEAAGAAATVTAPFLCMLADEAFPRGEVEHGFQLLARARGMLEGSQDAWAVLWPANLESDALLQVGRLEQAAQVGLRGFDDARSLGYESSSAALISVDNAVEALLARGLTAEAAALIDPLINGPVDSGNFPAHAARAGVDLVRGELDAAAQRLAQINVGPSHPFASILARDTAEVALWAGRPGEALDVIRRELEGPSRSNSVIFCGWLLAVGMRACADFADRARARRDEPALRAASTAVDDLTAWVDREHHVPFTKHPLVAAIPATKASWDAERSRSAGASDPAAWSVAAERWEALGYRHRAGYARWRQAEALLIAPRGGRAAAASVLSIAAAQAAEHRPLTTAIQDLARRARIDLSAPTEPVAQVQPTTTAQGFGLTDRELAVLQLLGQGKTNPEIAAALFISPRTAGVHVSNILRKLDATTRVQAATIAERAGLLSDEPTRPSAP
jgi:DNA-binding CsgD family transcriptional regulator